MELNNFDKLRTPDFKNGAVIEDIRKVYIALEETAKYNPLRNDRDAYLYSLYEWAIKGNPRPNPKDFGLR